MVNGKKNNLASILRYLKKNINNFFAFLFRFFIKRNLEKSILIIRLDAIGDYILFRNFIELLKNSYEYHDYKITLLGNSTWQSLATELDSEYIDEFIWIDINKFHSRNLCYRLKKLKQIISKHYEIMLHPVYSRFFWVEENIIKFISADKKIGSVGNLSNITIQEKIISDGYYTSLIESKNDIIFEFYRNKEFFEKVLKTEFSIKKPFINLKEKNYFNFTESYALLFIGASTKFRKWSILNFVKVAEYLRNLGLKIVLCGGINEKEDAYQFQSSFTYDYIDLVGRTSLVDMLYIIKGSKIVVSNETSIPHFAVALNIKNIFVIYNGNHFGRFVPYPQEITNDYHVIYHPEIEKDLDNYKAISNNHEYTNYLDINDISYCKVISVIEKYIQL